MNGRKLGGVLSVCVLTLAVIAGYLSFQGTTIEAGDSPSRTPIGNGINGANEAVAPSPVGALATERSLPFSRPASLNGTEIDGGFRVDEQGHLIVDKSIKRLMDYFLGTVGEMTIEEIVANLETLVQGALPEPARSEALTILRNYIDYKQGLFQLEQEIGEVDLMSLQSGELGGMSERLRLIRETRVSFLGEEVTQAFFAEEEAVDQYTLKKLMIRNDASLNETEKQAQLEQAAALLPTRVREARAGTQKHEQLSVAENRLKNEGATAEQIYAQRAQIVGDAAAQSLAKLDAEREEFRQRLRQYRLEKKTLDETAMQGSDKAESLQRLRESHFSDVEIRRVAVLDKIGEE
jgi:lipase chaperone LimK